MNNIVKSQYSSESNDSQTEDINIKAILRTLLREKILIISTAFLSTVTAVVVTLLETPIYKGSFQIVVKNESNGINTVQDRSNQLDNLLGKNNDNKTQELILKSPLVLKPVFNDAKKFYSERGENIDNLIYNEWLKSTLEIGFQDTTQILNINFKDKDKKFILDILNSIREKYQDYSKELKEKELTKTLNYLENQQGILSKQTFAAIKKYNTFSIENGLGNIDGFASIEPEQIYKNNTEFKLNPKISSDAGQRYQNQFRILEAYEAKYLNLSSKLKPNSTILIDLENKIKNLKVSLKRPNEILIKYRELKKESFRKEQLLAKIEQNLDLIKLEIAKQRDPWVLISEPSIEINRVSPQRKKVTLITLFASLIFGSFIGILKEKKSGLIFEIEELKSLINCNFLDTIYLQNENLTSQLIESILQIENNNNKKIQIAYINLSNKELAYAKKKDFIKINLNDFDNYPEVKSIFIITTSGVLDYDQITLLNKYIRINTNKITGWFYLDYMTKFKK